MSKAKAPEVGSDIESYCTKCKTDTEHVIIALKEGAAKRVVCKICDGEHNYRKPKALREKEKRLANRKKAADMAAGKTSRRRKKIEPSAMYSLAEWKEKLRNETRRPIENYRFDLALRAGDVVYHPSFGEGQVRSVHRNKATIQFFEAAKMLICLESENTTLEHEEEE